jgi:hypothetical protein
LVLAAQVLPTLLPERTEHLVQILYLALLLPLAVVLAVVLLERPEQMGALVVVLLMQHRPEEQAILHRHLHRKETMVVQVVLPPMLLVVEVAVVVALERHQQAGTEETAVTEVLPLFLEVALPMPAAVAAAVLLRVLVVQEEVPQ